MWEEEFLVKRSDFSSYRITCKDFTEPSPINNISSRHLSFDSSSSGPPSFSLLPSDPGNYFPSIPLGGNFQREFIYGHSFSVLSCPVSLLSITLHNIIVNELLQHQLNTMANVAPFGCCLYSERAPSQQSASIDQFHEGGIKHSPG